MIKLSEYEQKMLNGEMGPFKQRAIKKIVDYAEALGAQELCKVTKATVFFGYHPYLDVIQSDDYNKIFSKMVLCSDDIYQLDDFSTECYTQTCSAPCDQYCYEPCGLTKDVFDKNRKFLDLTREAGVTIAGSCTPYLNGWIPLRGEHFVSTESSNILWSNSVFGAYGNADGLEATAWSAICGRTPLWGNHIAENRYATHVVDIQCKSKTTMDWDIIGQTLGRMLTDANPRPVLTGNFSRPDQNKLKRFFASLATRSGCEICHIVGITAEAPTLEAALNGHKPMRQFTITQKDYDETLAGVCDSGSADVQMIALGCPHYSLEEVREVAMMLKGRKVADGVLLQIWTDMSTQQLAKVNGYEQIIFDAGAYLLNSSCPLVCGRTALDRVTTGFLTDGAKQAHYLHTDLNDRNCKVFYGDTQSCIKAAISGRWEDKNGKN